MSFPVGSSTSLGKGLLAIARQVKASVKRARRSLGYLPPLASTQQKAREAYQKGLEGIAKIAQKGDRAAQIGRKRRR